MGRFFLRPLSECEMLQLSLKGKVQRKSTPRCWSSLRVVGRKRNNKIWYSVGFANRQLAQTERGTRDIKLKLSFLALIR